MMQLRARTLKDVLLAENVSPKIVAKAQEVWGADRRSLALMRIGLATILIFDLIDRAATLRAHYTDFGVLPRSILRDGLLHPWSFSLRSKRSKEGWMVRRRGKTARWVSGKCLSPDYDEAVDRSAIAGIAWKKPPLISKLFRHDRWAFYMMELPSEHTDGRLRGFGEYVCRFWNSASAPSGKGDPIGSYRSTVQHLSPRDLSVSGPQQKQSELPNWRPRILLVVFCSHR